jgi:serine/threonine-protein kinase
LEQRLRSGQPCRAEDLLGKYPSVATWEELALDLIRTEFILRQQLGQEPRPEEWYARFPQYRGRLEQQLPGHSFLSQSTPPQAATEAEAAPPGRPGQPPHPSPGWAPPRYDLLEELGKGGMGEVYRARDRVLGREVALKRIRRGRAGPEEVLRFRREAQAVARLQHRHIVPLHDLGEHDGEPFLVMGLVAGGNLSVRLADFADPRAAVALMEKVARAVQAAHEAGVVHRDLKPSNILFDDAGEPHVSDFGLAKFLDPEEGEEATQTGQVLGTPAYMAPEQAAGHGNRATAASDVWALGVILYELLTGRRPFLGSGSAMSDQVRTAEPPPPRALRPQLDRALETIVLQCLQKDPARRYATAGALADDLGRWQRREPVAARRDGWWRGGRRALRRLDASRLALAALLAVGLLAGGWLLVSQRLTPGPSPQEDDQREQARGDRGTDRREPAPSREQDGARRQAALASVQQELAAGRPVTLLGPDGLPRYYRWRAEEQRPPPLPARRRTPLDLESSATCLMELLPDPQRTRYRLSAEVSHLSATKGWVGVYFAGDEVQTPDGPELRFGTLTFAEQGEYAGQVNMDFVCYHGSEAVGTLASERWVVHRERLDRTATGSPWHTLAVEATPEKIAAFWDGRLFYTWIRAEGVRERDDWWARLHPFANPPPPPRFAARGELGLFVMRGDARFRNIVVAPF